MTAATSGYFRSAPTPPRPETRPATERELLAAWLIERGAAPADVEQALLEADEGFHGNT